MAAIILAIINLVIIILRAYLSGSVDRVELVRKIEDAQDQIDKMARSKLEEMREESRENDSDIESMQDEMDKEFKRKDSRK